MHSHRITARIPNLFDIMDIKDVWTCLRLLHEINTMVAAILLVSITVLLLFSSCSCTAFIISPLNRPTNKCTTNSNTYLTAKKNDGSSESIINRRDVLQQASIIAATSIMTPTISSASDNDDSAYLG